MEVAVENWKKTFHNLDVYAMLSKDSRDLFVVSDTHNCRKNEVLLDDVDVHPPHVGLGDFSDSRRRHIYVVV